MQMSSVAHDCCCEKGKMHEHRHGFMARIEDEIIIIRNVPALVRDTCSEIEYTLEGSGDIDEIRKEFLAWWFRAKSLAAYFNIPADGFDCMIVF
ncbi:MAG TPA: hypothetical protein PKV83_03565 [Methanothrix sp.]|nr:hypothetical protein [Methanothrix sp.]